MRFEIRTKDIALSGARVLRVFRFVGDSQEVIISDGGCFTLHLPRGQAQELAAALLLIASDDPVDEQTS